MIPVRGLEGQRVLVLGLGRSGLSAAKALAEGGAEPLCWDDSAEGRAKAEEL
ncbi:MAG: UDP-N-acetylmuramoyl-L-alanine--D-glutamate ligase, partial [Mangrovicoccus sp.]